MKITNIPDYIDIYPPALFAFIFIRISEAEEFFKFILTLIVIGYTLTKWVFMIIDRKNKKQNKDEKD